MHVRITIAALLLAQLAPVSTLATGGKVNQEAATLEAAFDPGRLNAAPDDPLGRLAQALWSARSGALENALAHAEAALAAAPEGEIHEQIARERDRLTKLRETRDAFLAAAVAGNQRLRLLIDGVEIAAKADRMEDGRLFLAKNKAGVESLEIAAIPAAALAAAMGKKAGDFGPEWVRPYGLLLGGDDRWSRYLDEKVPEEARLLAQGQSELPQLLARGEVLGHLSALAASPAQPDAARSAEIVSAIRALVQDHKAVPEVAAAREDLGRFAHVAFRSLFADSGLQEVLAAKVEPLEEGRVRLTYDFDTPRQLDDFKDDSSYEAKRREIFGKVDPPAGQARFRVVDGKLEGEGELCIRHKFEFDGPVRAQWRFELGSSNGAQNAIFNLMLGICDNRKGSYATCVNFGDLEVLDLTRHSAEYLHDDHPAPIQAGTLRMVEVAREGEHFVTYVDGEKKRELPPSSLVRGDVFLWAHIDFPFSVDKLVIEGRIAKTSLDEAEAGWVAARMAELGFGELARDTAQNTK